MSKKRRNHSPGFKSKVALAEQSYEAGRKHVQCLMRRMGMQAIHPGPKTSKPNPQHKLYPYLLRDLKINRANQVWANDVAYLPMASGFLYLTVIMDWHSRKVLSWRVSNSLDASFCVDALEEAILSAGMVKGLGETTRLSNACGAALTMKKFISIPMS